jgi:hypothetical protein
MGDPDRKQTATPQPDKPEHFSLRVKNSSVAEKPEGTHLETITPE